MYRGLCLLMLTVAVSSACSQDAPAAFDEDMLIAQGFQRMTFPDPDPGIPAYARVTHLVNQFYHDDGWLAIPFFRDPECIPADFNLLEMFHFPTPDGPGAFGCTLRHSGHYLVEDGAEQGTFPRLYISSGDDVPFWFVRWDDFQRAMADGVVTLSEIRTMNPRIGTATEYRETVQPRLDEHLVVTDASGVLEDGTPWDFHVTHVGDRTQKIHIRFR